MDSDDSASSTGSAKSCIFVLLPEDITAACTTDCTPERCDNATVRPCEPPELEPGLPGQFVPLEVPHRPAEVLELPRQPVDLFFDFVPAELVGRWVKWTNAGPPSARLGPAQRRSRSLLWKPTTSDELYLFLGILIYMGIHPEAEVARYWSVQQDQEDPIHPFTRLMTRDRFQLLFRRVRIFDAALITAPTRPTRGGRGRDPRGSRMPKVYKQVNEWSAHIQETGDRFLRPGSDLTVDEAMVRFTGRSMETTTIPTKPIPQGFKVWVLAQKGYCLRWLWHVHGDGPYGLVPQARPAAGDQAARKTALTPTQLVVTSLLALLPLATYHVFLDNLFASVKLFRALRDQKIGATGTCRKDGGIDKTLVAEKETEGRGIPWGQLHAISTADRQVNQFTWKDNALVLFLTTVFDETSEVVRNRRRPAGNTAAKKAAWEVFGPDVRKDLRIPLAVDKYNH
ncbi:PiggyBac transposable element-derived protein 4 [Colletotrichum tanaceti]|uniref:PiggyBac transposable element-derived protein 4 n=1 Tax=Colletotrichum tanaceti TaxID=1306861 RepID=A0A4U6X4A4_9PEZI|nr:PiggyBac transposable element-derived protein 4 [Colletotrichum tanaceti]TKW50200.1 PiggyBac transposable element-derived protein 4 [Colletotrichum tanaceti]